MGLLNLLYTYSTYGNYGNYGNYSNYGNTARDLTNNDWAAIVGGIMAGLGILIIVLLAVAILVIIANWKLFKKMGLEGWKSLIPFVKDFLQMEKTGVDQRWLLILVFGYIVLVIPILGWIAYAVAAVYFYILYSVSLARSFGKSDGFAVGLILLNPVFICILAFGDSKYLGAKPMNDVIFKNKETNTESPKSTTKKTGLFCPKCGEKVKASDSFCTKCGSKTK